MANRDELARNILHRLADEFLADELSGNGKLEMRITEMLKEEIDRFDINRILPVAEKP